MTELDFEKDASIDPDALDVEWLKQPELMFRYAREEAAAAKAFKEAWERVKIVTAQLIKKAKEDNPKATAQMIEAFYRDHPDHKTAKQRMLEAEYEYNLISAGSKAIYQKKAALENLVRLMGMDYFSSPCDPRDLAREVKKRSAQEEKSRAASAKMKRTRRTRNGKKK